MRLECLLNVPANYCPEIQIDGEDYKVFERVWSEVRELKFLKCIEKKMFHRFFLSGSWSKIREGI